MVWFVNILCFCIDKTKTKKKNWGFEFKWKWMVFAKTMNCNEFFSSNFVVLAFRLILYPFQYSWVQVCCFICAIFERKNIFRLRWQKEFKTKCHTGCLANKVCLLSLYKNEIVVHCGRVELFSVLIVYKIYFLLFSVISRLMWKFVSHVCTYCYVF